MLAYQGATKSLAMPAYDASMLVQLLDWVDWPSLTAKPNVADNVNLRFASNIDELTRRLNLSLLRQQHFARQLVVARTVQGGLVSSKADNGQVGTRDTQVDQDALSIFRGILEIPGWEDSALGHELVGLQHERLGQLDLADTCYKAMLADATRNGDTLQQATANWRLASIKYQKGTYQTSWSDLNRAHDYFQNSVTNDPRGNFRAGEFYELRFGCAKAADFNQQVPIAAQAAIASYGKTKKSIEAMRYRKRTLLARILSALNSNSPPDPWTILYERANEKTASIKSALESWKYSQSLISGYSVPNATPTSPPE
jgi:hypothetical protein